MGIFPIRDVYSDRLFYACVFKTRSSAYAILTVNGISRFEYKLKNMKQTLRTEEFAMLISEGRNINFLSRTSTGLKCAVIFTRQHRL